MNEKKMLKVKLQETEKMNISQNSELTEQDSAKKDEKEFLFPPESQKIDSNLNVKQDDKDDVSMGVEENEKVINSNNATEKPENLTEIIPASFLVDNVINDDDAIGESGEREATNITSNRGNHNIPYVENPYQANSTNFIIIGVKDT